MITFKELCENMNLESWHQNSHKLTKDSYGKPKMFYHGTKNDFDVFDVNRQKGGNFGKGFYFTDNIDAVNKNWASEEGSNVMPVYLKVIKPFDAKVINQEVIDKFLRENGDEDKIRDLSTNKNPAMYYKSLMSRVGHKFIDFLKKEGYDGVFGYSPAAGNQVVVFAPNQIKSKFAKSYSDSDKVTEIAIKGKAVKTKNPLFEVKAGDIIKLKSDSTGNFFKKLMKNTFLVKSPYGVVFNGRTVLALKSLEDRQPYKLWLDEETDSFYLGNTVVSLDKIIEDYQDDNV